MMGPGGWHQLWLMISLIEWLFYDSGEFPTMLMNADDSDERSSRESNPPPFFTGESAAIVMVKRMMAY